MTPSKVKKFSISSFLIAAADPCLAVFADCLSRSHRGQWRADPRILSFGYFSRNLFFGNGMRSEEKFDR